MFHAAAASYAPGWLLKSRMRWWDCRRSGFDDDRFPLTGRGGGICLDCFIPTMLSSCDWPTQTSLWKQEGEQGRGGGETAVPSITGRGRHWREGEHLWLCNALEESGHNRHINSHFTADFLWLSVWQVHTQVSEQEYQIKVCRWREMVTKCYCL